MASINGITIKNVKTFSGIEYPTCTECTVYNGKKKLGSYCEDQWGGEGHFSPNSLYEELKPFAENYKAGCKKDRYYEFQSNPENFLSKIIELHDYEKVYKKNIKDGKFTMFIQNSFKWMSVRLLRKLSPNEKLPSSLLNDIKKEFPNNDQIIWYAYDETPFNIIIDAEHPVPNYLQRH